jgi:cytoskeleton protein RodZ
LESFGARLKRERERQGMTLDSVATATKIGTRLLQALEDQQFDRLPGGIFNKGFVRAYARHLGLNEEQAIADYLTAAGGPPVAKDPEAVVAAIAARKVESRSEKQDARSGGFPWGKIAIFLLIVAVGLTFWSAHSRNSEKRLRENPVNAAPHSSSSQNSAAALRSKSN